ncbi:hypothetical protein CYLTODRAFT_364275 [Cylindrobasidium torrendii FP15055 ss-10]|uniref:Uncharacterized protein n=1 Tax=Cylindrobasidium torrendii FP15055 ss-10 TaxID=1314674 RepID=A0A0D7BUC1_9AGAR|nr:hypothetical protein CYLTODRAFT_364275 [Cylindrobasidium torrendii FP15055 ss-10]
MRRIASVFSHKGRSEKKSGKDGAPSAAATTTTSKTSIRRATTGQAPPAIVTMPWTAERDMAQCSSASSSGSASLQTPEDVLPIYPEPVGPTPAKHRSWINTWLPKKPSTTLKGRPSQQAIVSRDWQPSSPPVLRAPPPGNKPSRPSDTDSDESESEEDDDDDDGRSPPRLSDRSIPHSASAMREARQYLSARLQNSIDAAFQPQDSPFLIRRAKRSPVYPRSSNPGPLPANDSLRALTLRRRLLHRLTDPAARLSTAEQTSILPFSTLAPPPRVTQLPSVDVEVWPHKLSSVSPHPPGLRRWVDRPCFEQQHSVWLLDANSNLTRQIVAGTRFAVPDLEFSLALEAMVDFNVPIPVISPPKPAMPSTRAASETSGKDTSASRVSITTAKTSLTAPSPLRMQTAPPSINVSQSGSPPRSPTHGVKRGVRFAEGDEKEDHLPVGYVARVKQQREAKARFLAEEKGRRQVSEEQLKLARERQKMEDERKKFEQERRAWEAEKKAMEDDRKKRNYADELAASRSRQELMRNGANRTAMVASGSASSLRETVAAHSADRTSSSSKNSRANYDRLSVPDASHPTPRRGVSETNTQASSQRRYSGGGSPLPSPQLADSSRPSSVYSSSSEDVKARRQSSTGYSNTPYGYGYWGGSNSSLTPPMPTVPTLPAFPFLPQQPGYFMPAPGFMPSPGYIPPPSAFDMPLLPPSAPFMTGQRSRSRNSSNASGSSSPNRSTDRIPRVPSQDGHLSSSGQRSVSSSPHRAKPQHYRTSSNEGLNGASRNSVSQSQRGRPQEPASMLSPNSAHTPSSRSQTNGHPSYATYTRTMPSRRSTALS